MTDSFIIETQPAPVPLWHYERLKVWSETCEWERFDDPGCLQKGDIFRIVEDQPMELGDWPRGTPQDYLVMREPMKTQSGWATYTQPVNHTTFLTGS